VFIGGMDDGIDKSKIKAITMKLQRRSISPSSRGVITHCPSSICCNDIINYRCFL
jgi:hypothetical protein